MRWNLGVAALAASWGFISIIVSHLEDGGMSAPTIVFWRVGLAALALVLGAIGARRTDILRLGRHKWWILAIGAGLALHWGLYFETIKLSSVSVAVLTVYTSPIFLALLAPLFLPEHLSRAVLIALPIAASGLALLSLSGSDSTRARPLAIASGVAAAFVVALLVIAQKRIVRDVNPVGLSLWIDVAAILALVPVLPFAGRFVPSAGDLGLLVLVGVVFTALSGLIWLVLLRHVTAQAMGFLSYLEPVSASLLAWPLLGQRIGAWVAVGGVLVLVAGSIVVLGEPAETAVSEVAGVPQPDAALSGLSRASAE
jgi:drug/metabolite transporter (DMT)-like permease